jgi:hypothetical protein
MSPQFVMGLVVVLAALANWKWFLLLGGLDFGWRWWLSASVRREQAALPVIPCEEFQPDGTTSDYCIAERGWHRCTLPSM